MTFEYRLTEHTTCIEQRDLNKLAVDGWELVTVLEHHHPGYVSIWRRAVGHPFSIQKIRDHVEELQETYVRGQQTGYEACADILDFIDHEILS